MNSALLLLLSLYLLQVNFYGYRQPVTLDKSQYINSLVVYTTG